MLRDKLEFPKNADINQLYDYIFKLVEILEISLSNIGEENLSQALKEKLGLSGDEENV